MAETQTLKETLEKYLTEKFQGSMCELELLPRGAISGNLVWKGFEGQDHSERQHQLWEAIKREFPEKSQRLQISAILTLTPDEVNVELEP